jgi:hypothetical protein
MSLESRVERLENAIVQIASTLDEHTGLLRTQGQLLRDIGRYAGQTQGQLLRDIVVLLSNQSDRLKRIERAIRERGSNGHAR